MNWKAIEGKEILIANKATIAGVIREIKRVARESAKHPEIIKIAERLGKQPGNIYKTIFDYCYNAATYEPDPLDHQRIKYAHRTIKDKRGNCVDYSILISAIMQNLNLPHVFKIVSFGAGWEHIYIVAGGYVLDCVINQKQDGTETFSNRSKSSFNIELPYKAKKEFMPKLSVLAGTRNYRKQAAVNGFNFSNLLYLTPAAPFKFFADFVSPQLEQAKTQAATTPLFPQQQPYNTNPNYYNNPTGSAGFSTDTILLAGAGVVAAYFLLTDKKKKKR